MGYITQKATSTDVAFRKNIVDTSVCVTLQRV